MKRLSYTKIAYWFFGLIVAVLAALSLLLSFLDWNQYRVPLAELASNQMGMRVELAGDVSIGLLPRPRVSAETVRLFPATEGFSEVVATADRIGVNLGVSSLLQGRVSLQSMRLDGLDITLEEKEGGTWRVRGWPETEEETGPSIDLLRFNLVASRATLLPLSGAVYPVEGISLILEGTLPKGPLSWDGEFTIAEQRITSNGRVRPVSVRDELSVKADFALAGNSLSISGRIQPEGNLTGRIQLAGDSLAELVTNVAKVAQAGAFSAPNLPYNLDVQLDKEGEITRLVSRDLTISDTRGRLDLTVAGVGHQNHLTGTVSMGVIDFDNWLKATPLGAAVVETVVSDEKESQLLGGAIDLHIEGFQVRNGLGQRIDAVVGFGVDGVNLTSVSALLPGATNAAFTGKLGPGGGQGKLLVEAGNISELASWLGLAFPDGIPSGRLTTARLKADFTHFGENWILSDIAGQLDNTNVTGEIGGGLSKSGPWQVRVEADSLNLDAYLPETVSEQGVEAKSLSLPEQTDVVFDISIGDLQLLDRSFNSTRFVGVLRDEKLDVSQMVSFQQQGKIELSGNVEQGQGQPRFDVSINLSDWSAPVASYFVPNLPMMMQSLRVDTVNGTMTLVGAKDALNLGLDITNGEDLLSLSGVVGLANNTFSRLDLQGSFSHSDLAGLLRYNEIIDLKSLPIRASLNISKPTVDSALQLRMGGDAAGGDMTSDLLLQNGLKKLGLTYNHINVAEFSKLTGLKLSGFDHSASLRSDLEFEAESFPDDWTLTLNMLRNGGLSASGTLAVSGAKQIVGRVDLAGADINFQSSRDEAVVPAVDLLTHLSSYTGTLDIVFDEVFVAGQKLDAQAASLILGDGTLRMSLGDAAKLNDETMSATVNVVLSDAFPYDGTLNASKFDIGELLLAEGLQQILSATGTLDLTFSGQADSPTVLRNMKAAGSLRGHAATLNFMSVSGLVGEIQTAQTSRAFLDKVGTLLRRGTTQVQSVEGVFSLDSGIMLLERTKADGSWGSLSLDGQLNFPDEFMNLKGELALNTPPDTPAIPLSYQGRFDNPSTQLSSRLFERFVISIIERRLRATLFRELDERTKTSAEAGSNPGMAVFNRAFSLLNQLRKAQEEKRVEETSQGPAAPEGDAQ